MSRSWRIQQSEAAAQMFICAGAPDLRRVPQRACSWALSSVPLQRAGRDETNTAERLYVGSAFPVPDRRVVDRGRHKLGPACAFGDAAVFRIIEARVGDLKAGDERLCLGDYCGEPRRTDRLRVEETGSPCVDPVGVGQGGIDSLKVAE